MTGKMKAQVFYKPEDMRLETVDIPQIEPHQVLVRVQACGICGSDVAYYYGRSPLETPDGLGPLILGHEFSGDVVEVGSLPASLGLFQPGDRVLANPVQNCNACPQCSRKRVNLCQHSRVSGVSYDGAFAEYAVVNYTHLHHIPDSVSYETAALCEPLACANYGVEKLNVQIGDFVLIFGPGTIGLMMLQLIRARGAGKIAMVGVLDFGLNKAKTLGADYVFNTLDQKSPYYCPDLVREIVRITDGNLADRVIVPTSAKPALQGALTVSGQGANIVFFGLPGADTVLEVPLLQTLQMDKSINFSWLAPFTWDVALKAIRNGTIQLSELITHRFTLSQLHEGLKLMNDSSKPEKIKAVISMD